MSGNGPQIPTNQTRSTWLSNYAKIRRRKKVSRKKEERWDKKATGKRAWSRDERAREAWIIRGKKEQQTRANKDINVSDWNWIDDDHRIMRQPTHVDTVTWCMYGYMLTKNVTAFHFAVNSVTPHCTPASIYTTPPPTGWAPLRCRFSRFTISSIVIVFLTIIRY